MTPDERQAPDIYDAQGECFACGALRQLGGHGRVEFDGSNRPCPLAKLAAQIEELRQAKNIPPRDASCCHSFGEWCDACVGGVVRQWNADRKRLRELEELEGRDHWLVRFVRWILFRHLGDRRYTPRGPF